MSSSPPPQTSSPIPVPRGGRKKRRVRGRGRQKATTKTKLLLCLNQASFSLFFPLPFSRKKKKSERQANISGPKVDRCREEEEDRRGGGGRKVKWIAEGRGEGGGGRREDGRTDPFLSFFLTHTQLRSKSKSRKTTKAPPTFNPGPPLFRLGGGPTLLPAPPLHFPCRRGEKKSGEKGVSE